MKKYTFTLLLLLCLLTITGGTFAAFTFYDGKVEDVKAQQLKPNMNVTTEASTWGTISIETQDFAISVEPTEDKVDYTAKLVFSGSIVAKFTPTASGADLTQFKGWEASVELVNANYNDTPIFAFDSKTITQDGHDNFTINTLSGLTLNSTFVLNTKEKADAFLKALNQTSITITIKEKTQVL